MKTIKLVFEDKEGEYDVEVPFEAIEQLYGELDLSPGTGWFKFGDCACGIGVLEEAKEKGVLPDVRPMSGCVVGISSTGFDNGGKGNGRFNLHSYDLPSHELGAYFYKRLGQALPNSGDFIP